MAAARLAYSLLFHAGVHGSCLTDVLEITMPLFVILDGLCQLHADSFDHYVLSYIHHYLLAYLLTYLLMHNVCLFIRLLRMAVQRIG